MGILEKLGIKKSAFTGLVVGGFMAILIGAVLLVVSYVVINAVVSGVLTGGVTLGAAGGAMNNSFWSTMGVVTQALGISGIALIIVGISLIIAVLLGLVGGAGGRK